MLNFRSRLIKIALRGLAGALSFLAAGMVLGMMPNSDWLPLRESFLFASLYAVVLISFSIAFLSEKSAWRFTSLSDLFVSLRDTVVSLAFLGSLLLAVSVPRAVIAPTLVVTLLIDTFFFGALKLARRAAGARALTVSNAVPEGEGTRLLIVGSLPAAEAYLRSAENDGASNHYRIAGIISSEPKDVGLIVRGHPVLAAASDLVQQAKALAQTGRGVSAVLFLSEEELSLRAEDLGLLRAHGCQLLRRSRIQDLNDSTGPALRELSVEELLYRSPIKLPGQALTSYLTGRRVLVTGGGGSIGSELCRQIVANGCAHLTVVDNSEYALFNIDMELSRLFPGISRRAVIMDVRDREGLVRLFAEEKPELVFHAAALKHVHLVEQNPCQGVMTNIFGTRNVAAAAASANIKQMVLISTDKAVAPSNVMGASKRVAEAVINSMATGSGPTYSAVRFGNVLGSAGSVVPIFAEQIQRGGPVTVTDPEVERYFMTIPEAVQLVLYSSLSDLNAKGNGRIYVLDMGVPVKIAKLAERMIQLHGKVPHKDIAIKYIGLRQGEKITEALVDEGETLEMAATGVFQIEAGPGQFRLGEGALDRLEALAFGGRSREVAELLFATAKAVRVGGHLSSAGDLK